MSIVTLYQIAQQLDADKIGIPKVSTNDNTIAIIVNAALIFVGAFSLLFVLIGAFTYVISQGDAKKTASAKNTILYALAGMVISGLAFAIVQFVLGVILK